jgi:hypothetical protein
MDPIGENAAFRLKTIFFGGRGNTKIGRRC